MIWPGGKDAFFCAIFETALRFICLCVAFLQKISLPFGKRSLWMQNHPTMFQIFRTSAAIALQTLRANLFHTLLSTLGIVIGVAALVSILALGDGMEAFARKQISGTTTLQFIQIVPEKGEQIEGVWMTKAQVPVLTETHFAELEQKMGDRANLIMGTKINGMLALQGDTIAKPVVMTAGLGDPESDQAPAIAHGRNFSKADFEQKDSLIVLSQVIAEKLANGKAPESLLDRRVVFNERSMRVIGIQAANQEEERPTAIMPMYLLDETMLKAQPPGLIIIANKVEAVPDLKAEVSAYLDGHFKNGRADFEIATHESRIEQVSKGIFVFKIVMGFITGIAILVGGIGVMNVLLMSVTERTREIGIRKATGARRRDISFQFLAEALAISLTGSLLGFALGMGITLGSTPIIRALTEMPFYAAFNVNSVFIILIIAVFIGVVFGVYPARKAARLTPVDAIRHE